jgi:hypothetical protein
MEAYGGVGVQIHIFLTSALVEGEWSVSRPGRFPPGEEVGWTSEPVWTTLRRENSWPYHDLNSDTSVVQPVASRYTDWAMYLYTVLIQLQNADK